MVKEKRCPVGPKGFVAILGAAAVLLIGSAGCGVGQRSEAVRPQGLPAGASPASNEAKQQLHGGPTPDQMKQIQEWKKTHPGASTRY
jgi:hypothetical protein